MSDASPRRIGQRRRKVRVASVKNPGLRRRLLRSGVRYVSSGPAWGQLSDALCSTTSWLMAAGVIILEHEKTVHSSWIKSSLVSPLLPFSTPVSFFLSSESVSSKIMGGPKVEMEA